MPVSGDIGQLRSLAAKLQMVRDGAVLKLAAERVAGAMLKLSADQFRSETDPYGEAWAKLKRERTRNRKARKRGKRGGQKIGQNTGRMRASFFAHAEGPRVIVGYPVEYAQWFSEGTSRQVARRLVPDERGLGLTWGAMVAREVRAALAEVMEA